MIRRLHSLFPSLADSVLNSYTQVYFSNNRVFAIILLVVTFFDPWAGLSRYLEQAERAPAVAVQSLYWRLP